MTRCCVYKIDIKNIHKDSPISDYTFFTFKDENYNEILNFTNIRYYKNGIPIFLVDI